MKKILAQVPGRTVYQGHHQGEVCHLFTDAYYCKHQGCILELPGKGALSHRVSSFLLSRLQALAIPSYFIRSLNMRESLMYEAEVSPFDVRVRCRSDDGMAARFGIEEKRVFESPLLEYITKNGALLGGEDLLYALGWILPEEIDDLHEAVIRITRTLQGLFIANSLTLVDMVLTMGPSLDKGFFLAGHLCPENICVWDEKEKRYWGGSYLGQDPLLHHRKIAEKLGLLS